MKRLHGSSTGTTLIELLVALSVLSVMLLVVGVSVGRRDDPPPGGQVPDLVREARQQAITTGRPVAVEIPFESTVVDVIARPDGTVLADTLLQLELSTGLPDAF